MYPSACAPRVWTGYGKLEKLRNFEQQFSGLEKPWKFCLMAKARESHGILKQSFTRLDLCVRY